MTTATAFFHDPRRRNLLTLLAIALLSFTFAWFALSEQAGEVAPHYASEPFLPGLAAHAQDVTRIHVVSRDGAFDVKLDPQKGFVLPGHGNYPASFEQLRGTIVGLAALTTIEPKTARADWLHFVGLDPPQTGGGGVQFTLYNDKGEKLADIVTGKTVDIGDPNGAIGLFVRKPGEQQSWLVRSVFQPKASEADWLDRNVLDIERARIQEVDVQPQTGAAYSVRREQQNQSDFAIVNMPAGRELAYPGSPDGIAAAIVGFTFDDVKPASGLDFSNATHIVTRTFDGLNVALDVIKNGADYWATISAEAAPGKPEAEKEARAIDARSSRWAYKLPQFKGQQFMTPLESLLKPPGAPKK
ncbi:MAG TPA: DUF4340 domain-containing protein [Rhizomicrobium sp.]|jgi:hypothetical protein|nr:DUF4340 domain-containing protein [Rhizomicrobium sp.]